MLPPKTYEELCAARGMSTDPATPNESTVASKKKTTNIESETDNEKSLKAALIEVEKQQVELKSLYDH